MCVCVDKSEAKLKQLSFTEEVNTSGNLHWMLGCVGLPRAGTSITAHVQHLFTSLRQTFTPPACPLWEGFWGDKEALIRFAPRHPVFWSAVMSWKTRFFWPRILRPHLRPQYYPANGVVSSRERETAAVNTLELPTAAVACNHPWFFSTFPQDYYCLSHPWFLPI